ncbi:MAG: SUMF1/EgtB/PvdO family nonheme iron enzyme [Thermodesulfobacteriota bacterium]
MEFSLIPAGSFLMGSPDAEAGREFDERQHQVTLEKSFYLQTTEVTQGQWLAVMGDNPATFTNCGPDCPVERVSWNEVQQFLVRLNGLSDHHYRLPSESEWEYACREGESFSSAAADMGDPLLLASPSLDELGWYVGNSQQGTHPVKGKRANRFGLYDMQGNVWEWVGDWKNIYAFTPASDRGGPVGGSAKVRRGGAWNVYDRLCRCSYRSNAIDDNRDAFTGFRLVLEDREEASAEKSEGGTGDTAAAAALPVIHFAYDSYELDAEARGVLDGILPRLLRSESGLQIHGHACDLGASSYNDQLAARRAEAVRAHLEGAGIAAGRLTVVSHGEKAPAVSNDTDGHRRQNRRVELRWQ